VVKRDTSFQMLGQTEVYQLVVTGTAWRSRRFKVVEELYESH